jgi:uncharacterized protein HemY
VLATKIVELVPNEGSFWNTLGMAHYRAGDWKAAVEALNKSIELHQGAETSDWFFLGKTQPKNEELLQLRAEAGQLLNIETEGKPK